MTSANASPIRMWRLSVVISTPSLSPLRRAPSSSLLCVRWKTNATQTQRRSTAIFPCNVASMKWVRRPQTTAGHYVFGDHRKRASLTGHWGAISVGLRGFAPLLSGEIGDCNAQVRPEGRRQKCAEDAPRVARFIDRTLSSSEASFLSGLDRGQTFQGIAATLRCAVLPARARVPGESEATGFPHERQFANFGERESGG